MYKYFFGTKVGYSSEYPDINVALPMRSLRMPCAVARSRPYGFALAVAPPTAAMLQGRLHRVNSPCRPCRVALKTHLTNICFRCFRCFRGIFQVFRMDVAKVDSDVAMTIHVCCKNFLKMFHLFQTYVASVITRCCICCNGYVVSVYSKCFIYFQTHVAIVSSECCKSKSRYRVVEPGRKSWRGSHDGISW
jgi:hypothetical protein